MVEEKEADLSKLYKVGYKDLMREQLQEVVALPDFKEFGTPLPNKSYRC